LAVDDSLAKAYQKALATDSTSAFGSVISVSRTVDGETADLMSELFIECIVAPGFTEEAIAILTQKKNLRLLSYPSEDPEHFLLSYGQEPEARLLRSVYGGMLAQTPSVPPRYVQDDPEWEVVSAREPSDEERDDLRFAWAAIFGVKSNAIVLARGGAVLGIGAGQMSRVDSSKIAVRKAGEGGHDLTGAVLASDAFFPFRDAVDAAADAGIQAVIQPGGSIRDDEVLAAANEHGISMIFTGRRLFRH